jgi:poly(U)-specific endoribonuclease
VGELDGDKVDGLHNWIRFYVLEKNASEHFDYRGFVVKRSVSVFFYFSCPEGRGHIFGYNRKIPHLFSTTPFIQNILGAFKFTWKDELKPTGSFLLGTSPEFEMAVDTLCFLLKRGRNRCKVQFSSFPLIEEFLFN